MAYQSASQILEFDPEPRPSCIVLDLKMPGLTGLQVQEQLAERNRSVPVIFLTGHGDIEQSVSAMKGGAVDFLTKPVSKPKLLAAIERALSFDKRLNERRALADECKARYETLTPREKQVYEKVVRGRMNKQIAYTLGTSERTIKAHRQKIMQKLRVNSIAELVTFAERFNSLAPSATEPKAISREFLLEPN
jgi:FixJ family two-component response regulator